MFNRNQILPLLMAQQHLPMREALELTLLGAQNQGVSLMLTQKIAKDIGDLHAEKSNQATALTAAKAKITALEIALQDAKETSPEDSAPEEIASEMGTEPVEDESRTPPAHPTELESLRRELAKTEAARADLREKLSEEKRLHRNTEGRLETRTNRVNILETRVETLAAKAVEPLNRKDFDTDSAFKVAAQTQALNIMTRVMSPASLDATSADVHIAALQKLPTEVKEKFSTKLDALHAKFEAEIKAEMPEHFDVLFPSVSND
jgi:chromosome segregation ATPase